MKVLTQLAGIILVCISVVLLVVEFASPGHNNSFLLASGIILLVGLVAHVILNKQFM